MKTKFPVSLTAQRKLHGCTQLQMAEQLGISVSLYNDFELGVRYPDYDTLEDLADILDCSLDLLFGRSGKISGVFPDLLQDSEHSYQAESGNTGSKSCQKLAVGAQDFRFLREQNTYFVDKSLFIDEFLNSWYQVTLITRPRRFGKTLNMSMLAEFLDCTKNSAALFTGTKICEKPIFSEINEHPVVFLSFLTVKADHAGEMQDQIAFLLLKEYERHLLKINLDQLPDIKKTSFLDYYQSLRLENDPNIKKKYIINAVTELCEILELYYHKKVYLLLDEYDTPFLSANSSGCYEEIKDLLTGLLISSLKGNSSLEKALLTGIQRVAKENIFSGLNNLIVCSVKDTEYEDCFGFTEAETRDLLCQFDCSFSDEVKKMYDGYCIGSAKLYNPWSVTCYAARKKLESYWVNTSENTIIKTALKQCGESFSDAYQELIEKGTADVFAELSSAYYEKANAASLWGLLIDVGMVTIESQIAEHYYKIRIPNMEIWTAFQDLII